MRWDPARYSIRGVIGYSKPNRFCSLLGRINCALMFWVGWLTMRICFIVRIIPQCSYSGSLPRDIKLLWVSLLRPMFPSGRTVNGSMLNDEFMTKKVENKTFKEELICVNGQIFSRVKTTIYSLINGLFIINLIKETQRYLYFAY